ncbi:Hydrocephalus-inducing protein [Ceratobasidium theobromae]|uniref:Hydrocephalus-inducing protein n=1 Tax=Ceratobasidium theobromae TaxID=1582974 RepID=A0A5N5Q7M1_9AGAM|nr:Hydrocephalus-inducing protein [Ceratobasidium theobromae]
MNRTMTARRVAARAAPVGSFQRYLESMCQRDRLVACLTTSFDGLEACGNAELEAKTIMLHGDNRLVRCCWSTCEGKSEEETASLDDQFLCSTLQDGVADTTGLVCGECRKKYVRTAIAKRKSSEKALLLRPAVQLELVGEMIAGETRSKMLGFAQKSQLLLIVGQTLKSQSLLDLTRDLADAIHARSGAVIYVAQEPLRGRNSFSHIDAQLQLDSAGLVTRVTEAMNNFVPLPVEEIGILNNELPPTAQEEDPHYPGEVCEHCLCGVPEYLIKCVVCMSCFCFRRINYDESSSAPLDDAGSVRPIDEPGEDDPFPFEDACVILNHYSADGYRPPLEQAKADFKCLDCWDRSVKGLYPHFVKPVPRLRQEGEAQSWPRMAVLLYYIEQFWPIATHLTNLITARWAIKGWACQVQPVKLETLHEKKPVFMNMTWEEGSYSVFVVYLTHGLSDEQGYQLTEATALQPVEFLNQTLAVPSEILRKARNTQGFLLSCGHPLRHSGFVASLQQWFEKGPFDTLLGAMNTRLSVAYMLNLIARLSTCMVERGPNVTETMFQMWLTDSVAASHTDVLCFARGREPTLWLYAPFQSRPLGKPLPSIMSTCSCPDMPTDRHQALRRLNSRKAWEVDHNGADGVALRDVVVKATCTVCRQMWPLPSEHLAGTLRKYGGTFAAVVPYLAPS